MTGLLKLQGKAALVTGGGRGLGRAVALAFAREGCRVAVASRTLPELEEVVTEARGLGVDAFAFPSDVGQEAEVARLVEEATRRLGALDVLVNAAGVYGPIGPTAEVSSEAWVQAVQVNLLGTFYCCRHALPGMINRGAGKIINFSGGGATAALPRLSAYATTKAAVVRFTETLAEEVRQHGIQVNAVAPGPVDTKLQDAILEAGDRAGDLYLRTKRMRETGEGGVPPELAASLAVFLASQASDGLTGKLIAAPYDGWERWGQEDISQVMAKPWFTLRRLDPFTLKPFMPEKL